MPLATARDGIIAQGGYGRIYRKPADGRRTTLLTIPPRPALGAATRQECLDTEEGLLVRIVFPLNVGEGQVHWEQHGDVLEVEYLGMAFSYYHAFLVPADKKPSVSQDGRTLVFRFPEAA